MADVVVTLGGYEFEDFEIPDGITLGGGQIVHIHKLIGGRRVIDAMGPDDAPKSWSGRFRGPDAPEKVRNIDAMRKAGQPVSLTWSEFAFTVVVTEFQANARGNNEFPYTITCEVVSDDATPGAGSSEISADEMIGDDLNAAEDLSGALAEPGLSGAMDKIAGAVAGVRSFVGASTSTLAQVLTPIAEAREIVGGLIGEGEGVLNSFSAIGGIVQGVAPASMASGLLAQTEAMIESGELYDVDAHLGRMEGNLGSISHAGARITVAGADLFRLARLAYGDATEWATIARANGLTDPTVVGVRDLIIPPTPSGDGGVLGQ